MEIIGNWYIYMASAPPGEDNGHKNQPNSEPVPQTIELIKQILLCREHRQPKQYNGVAGGPLGADVLALGK